jgi:hypothetical protein
MTSDIVKTERITPTGIILLLLSICVMVIMGMTASWAHGVDARQTAIEAKQSTLEQNYGAISAQLQYLREAQNTMDAKLDRLLMEKRMEVK